MGTISDKLIYLAQTKTAIANAIAAKGVEVTPQDAFGSFVTKIEEIPQEGADPAYESLINDLTYGKTTYKNLFYNNTSITTFPSVDTSSVTNMDTTFMGCTKLETVKPIDFYNVKSMVQTFSGCTSLTTVPEFNTSNVTMMTKAFYGCSNLISIPSLDTSKTVNAHQLFYGCSKLVSLPPLDLSKLSNANSNTMNELFRGCSSLKSIEFVMGSSPNTPAGEFYSWFYGCTSLTSVSPINFSKYGTSSGVNCEYMFYNCSSLVDFGYPLDFKGKSLRGLGMFSGCTSLETLTILNGNNMYDTTAMFRNCSSLVNFSMNGINLSIDLSNSPLLSLDSLVNLINNLKTISGKTLTLGAVNIAKLTPEQIAVATGKGWTVN